MRKVTLKLQSEERSRELRIRKKKRISVNIDVARGRYGTLLSSLFVARRAPRALYAKKAGCHMTWRTVPGLVDRPMEGRIEGIDTLNTRT